MELLSMQEIIKKIFADKISGWSVGISICLLLLMLLAVAILYRFLPPYLPVYNKLAWGYARVGHTFELFFPLLLALLFLVINSYIGMKIQQRIPLLARFLFISVLSLSIFTTIFVVKVITIVL